MTWTKLGSEFFDDLAEAELSDAAARTHVEAIGYLYDQENYEMRLRKSTMRRWAGSAHAEQAAAELVAAGLWTDGRTEWTVVHHADVIRQSLAAQLKKRDDDKERIRKKRAAEERRQRDVGSDIGTDAGSGVGGDVGSGVRATQTDRQTDRQDASKGRTGAERIDPVTGEVLDSADSWANTPAVPSPSEASCHCGKPLLHPFEQDDGVCFEHMATASAGGTA